MSGLHPEGCKALEGMGTGVLTYGLTDDGQGKYDLDWKHAGNILRRRKVRERHAKGLNDLVERSIVGGRLVQRWRSAVRTFEIL